MAYGRAEIVIHADILAMKHARRGETEYELSSSHLRCNMCPTVCAGANNTLCWLLGYE